MTSLPFRLFCKHSLLNATPAPENLAFFIDAPRAAREARSGAAGASSRKTSQFRASPPAGTAFEGE